MVIGMPRMVSTFSGSRPTASSARFSTRCRLPCAMLSRSRVSSATLTFFSVGTSRVATITHSSVSSRACRVCSSKLGQVSTTTYSNSRLRVRIIRATRVAVTRSRASGRLGAASTISDWSWRVSSDSTIAKSMESSPPMASSMVWCGKSCMVIATSPKARSRSTRQTLRAPPSARARARFTEVVVLPTPPLGEKTVTTLPSLVEPAESCPPCNAFHSCWARPTAAVTAPASSLRTTSRAPACIAL
ncbi:hypothetical protein NODU109028_20885 [Nocardioides dubius]